MPLTPTLYAGVIPRCAKNVFRDPGSGHASKVTAEELDGWGLVAFRRGFLCDNYKSRTQGYRVRENGKGFGMVIG